MRYKLKEDVRFHLTEFNGYSENPTHIRWFTIPKGTILNLEPVEEEKTVQSFTEILDKLPARVLTDEEVELLHNNGKGVECDFSGCSTKEKPWPQVGDKYWFVWVGLYGTVEVDCAKWYGGATWRVNDFRTKEEAEHAAQKVRELLASLKK